MGRFENKTVVITGGNSGLGLATAKLFASEGAQVFITGRRQAELDAAVKEIGGGAEGVQGDVSKLADLDRLYEAVQRKGQIDVLFANAGGGEFAPLGSITEEHFDRAFNVNVRGLLFTVQKALPLLKSGSSVILNASIVATKGFPAFSVYSATKAAVRSFARTWSVDLKDRKIRVNSISPGIVPTPGYNNALGMSAGEVDQFVANALPNIPSGRAGTPEEIAKAVAFLASDESSYVNGVDLAVDGGFAQI